MLGLAVINFGSISPSSEMLRTYIHGMHETLLNTLTSDHTLLQAFAYLRHVTCIQSTRSQIMYVPDWPDQDPGHPNVSLKLVATLYIFFSFSSNFQGLLWLMPALNKARFEKRIL